MAPPRQRATAVHDDSRSEGSSTTREHKTGTGKGRKAANSSAVVNSVSHAKISASVANVTSAPMGDGDQSDNQPKIHWSEMPLEFLHSYRHAYKISSPSAYPTEYSQLLLSKGIGLLSPTSIAAQRAQLRQTQNTNGSQTNTKKPHHPHIANRVNGTKGPSGHNSKNKSAIEGKNALNHIIGQDRVSKNHLAFTVRKHFNSAGLAEQEAIARFLYKVREEGRGRQFRLRFQP
ncbi:hypothetical protein BDV33DRAFT_178074 [Aspergillus novoparasiticus]|uniref:Histone deacetylase complex subunit SAP30 Sin3 binding domain-containing protein n=1 Tax=Aspergillus novoparasiticus TaxID=986946 RepID=A0A5N6EKL3_9EURO|nr:hypothetical protein BDV33DRAFT_178074 [Aspergillus novoparasiticus]